jgi:folate-binding protein YgfZ
MAVTDLGLTNNIASALSALHTQAGHFVAEHYGLLQVSGKDSASFLQSQLTNNINELKPGIGQFTCLLDRKAHVIAYFHLFKSEGLSTELFYILVEKEQIPNLIQNLEQYRFAAHVELSDCSKDGKFIAIQGPRVNQIFGLLENNVYLNKIAHVDTCDIKWNNCVIRIFRHSITGEIGYFFWASNKDLPAFSQFVGNACHSLGFVELNDDVITKTRIESGLLKFGIDFDQNNLLPETGLIDQTVNYKKGCFIGQEIIARVRSHGLPAKAIIGLTIENKSIEIDKLSFPLNSSLTISGEEIGIIKSNTFSPTINKLLAFALLKRDYRVPQKEFSAQIGQHSISATVTILPFIQTQSNKELARKLYEQAVQKYVQGSESVLPTESINLLKEVLILDPQLEDAYEALAVILSKREQLEEAIVLMKNLAQLNPDSVMSHSNLSQFYVQQGLKELAEEEKAIALSIRMKLAAAQVTNKQAEEADKDNPDRLRRMEMFKQVLAIDPEDFFANAGLGECLVAQKDFTKAIDYLKKAIVLKPIHTPAYLDLAKAYRESGNNTSAKETLTAGIAIATKRGDMKALQQLQDELTTLS